MDRLKAWKLFVRVAESGALSRAAAAFGMSQPSVSRAIADLEAAYGARLLNRTTRRLSLTEAGERAYKRALLLLEEADALEAELRVADHEPVGLLRVSASIAHARAELVPHAGAFLQQHPHIRIDFATDDARIDLVAEGVDLAFRLGALTDSSLTARGLGAYHRVLVAAPELLKRIGPIKSPTDLAGAPCLRFSTAAAPSQWSLSSDGETRAVAIDGPARASSGRVLRDLAVQGVGIAFAPCFLVRRDLESGALIRVLPDWIGPCVEAHAVWPSGRNLPRKARAFLDFIAPRLTTVRV